MGLKLKVTGQGQDAVTLTSILDRWQFSGFEYFLIDTKNTRL